MGTVSPEHRAASLPARVRGVARAIENGDDAQIEETIRRLSRRHRLLGPLGLTVGAFALMFHGLKLIVSDWRLTVVQLLPAMWVWAAMADLRAHLLHGRSALVLMGPILIPIGFAVVAITAACFYLNAVFAFAISNPGRPNIRRALVQARHRLVPILSWGVGIGAALAFCALVVTRWRPPWFTLCLGVVIGVMAVSYVAVPARLLGVEKARSRGDKVWTSIIAGLLSATVSAPPYVLARVGLLMLGSKLLLIPGIILLVVGATMHAGATSAVRAIKLSARLAPQRS